MSASPPSHKLIPGTGFIVDGFRYPKYQAKAWWLTHCHSDHYTGLSETWSGGLIYCSEPTARLLTHLVHVDPAWIRPLPMDTPVTIQGVTVILVEANHCPGAAQLLFQLPDGRRYVHCGDMRFHTSMQDHPLLLRWRGAEAVFLDTTYCNKKHTLPLQEVVLQYVAAKVVELLAAPCAATALEAACPNDGATPSAGAATLTLVDVSSAGNISAGNSARAPDSTAALAPAAATAPDSASIDELQEQGGQQQQPPDKASVDERLVSHTETDAAAANEGAVTAATLQAAQGVEAECGTVSLCGKFPRLFLISTYVIGKERILLAIHAATGLKVHVNRTKMATLAAALSLSPLQLREVFTTDPMETPVHVVGWGFLGETWPYFRPNWLNLEAYRATHGAAEIVAFCPTGWMYEMKHTAFPVRSKEACSIHLVPYSEHSSYNELLQYVRFLRPQQVIPTVGVEGDDAEKKLKSILKHFNRLIDDGASKARLFTPRGQPPVKLTRGASLPLPAPPSTTTAAASDAAAGTRQPEQQLPAAGTARDPFSIAPSCQIPLDLCCSGSSSSSEASSGSDGSGCERLTRRPSKRPRSSHPAEGKQRVALPRHPWICPGGRAAAVTVPVPPTTASVPRLSAFVDAPGPPQAKAAAASSPASATAGELQLMSILQGNGISLVQARALIARGGGEVGRAVALFYDGDSPPPRASATHTAHAAAPSKLGASSSHRRGSAAPAKRTPRKGAAAPTSAGQDCSSQEAGTQAGQASASGSGKKGGSSSAGASGVKQRGVATASDPAQRSIVSFFRKPSGSQLASASQPGSGTPSPASRSLVAGSQQGRSPDTRGPLSVARACADTKVRNGAPGAHGPMPAPDIVMGSDVSAAHGSTPQHHQGSGPPVHSPALELDTEVMTEAAAAAAAAAADSKTQPPQPAQAAKPKLLLPRVPNSRTAAVAGAAGVTFLSAPRVCRDTSAPGDKSEPSTSTAALALARDAAAAAAAEAAAPPSCASHAHLLPPAPSSTLTHSTGSALEDRGGDASSAAAAADPPTVTDGWDTLFAEAEGPVAGMASTPGAAAAAAAAAPSSVGPALQLMGRVLRMNAAAEAATSAEQRAPQGRGPATASVSSFFTPRSQAGASQPLSKGKAPAATSTSTTTASHSSRSVSASTTHDPPHTAAPPVTLGGALASAPASAAAITAAYESARDALLLPLGQYDPVGHACWGPRMSAQGRGSLADGGSKAASVTGAAVQAPACETGPVPASYTAPYLHITAALAAVDSTTKRLRIADALTNMFRSLLALCPSDLLPSIYLLLGRVAPQHEGLELSVGGATVSAALGEATGSTRGALRALYTQHGDLGDVAQACRRGQPLLRPPAPLTVAKIFATLRSMALDKGTGSATRRQKQVVSLLRSSRDCEVKYLVRTLIQNLRVGANWRSVIGPLARAVAIHQANSPGATGPPGAGAHGAGSVGACSKATLDAAVAAVTAAFHTCPSFDVLVPTLLEGGWQALAARCIITPGIPVKPMLAKISEGVADALRQLHLGTAGSGDVSGNGSSCLAEYKYDGQRAQIHLLADGSVRIFSRNEEDRTSSFPDVAQLTRQAAAGGATSLIVDAEIVAVEFQPSPAGNFAATAAAAAAAAAKAAGGGEAAEQAGGPGGGGSVVRLKAFQELSTRARGKVEAHQVTIQVAVFVFDLLYADGQSLLQLPLRERRHRIATAMPHMSPGRVQMADSIEVSIEVSSSSRHLTHPQRSTHHPVGTDSTAAVCDTAGVCADRTVRSDPSSDQARGCNSGMSHGVRDPPAAAAGHRTHSDHPGVGRGELAGQAVAHGAAHPVAVTAAPAPPLPGCACSGDSAPLGPAGGGGGAAAVEGPAEDGMEARVTEFLMRSLDEGAEGLMLKRLDGPRSIYEPSKRADSWIKVKRDYCEGIRDSLDVVVIGAWQGQGRKVKWYSPFLLAIWDPESETYQSLCRCISGFSDAFYADATYRLSQTIVDGPKPMYYDTFEQPSVFFRPTEVWELRGADLTLSPVHRAAAGVCHAERGISLRFPRFIQRREDKLPEDASTPDYVSQLYNKQSRRIQMAPKGGAARTAATSGSEPLVQGGTKRPKSHADVMSSDEGGDEDSSVEEGDV
ncbi:MAG: hypothetical protein WDW36_001957 [Sanguina aurantia]